MKKNQGNAVVSVLVVIAVVLGLWLVGKAMWAANVADRAVTGVIEKTADPQNIINQYEDFKRLYESYQSLTAQYEQAHESVAKFEKDNAKPLSKSQEERYNFLVDVENGLKFQRKNVASDYNARVKMANRDIFRNTFVDKHFLPDNLAY